ncbi:hypothetical protein MASR1M66_24300 [Aminivibrio sp.]
MFKEVQRLKTQLDQYTDLTEEHEKIEQVLLKEKLQAFKGVHLKPRCGPRRNREARRRRVEKRASSLISNSVLFASAVIDYDYIMALIAKYSSRSPASRR